MDESLILWDVIEEHLDEAEFLFEMWGRAIVAPDYTWHDVERSFGERLRAHLDAIVIAGEPAARRLLVPGLGDEESEKNRAAACALALLEMPGEEHSWQVFQALVNAPVGSELRAGIARALEVSGRKSLDDELKAAVTYGGGEQVAELWAALATRRVDVGASAVVAGAIAAGDVALRTAALRAAVMRPAEELWGVVAPWLEAPEESVRMAAIETAMTWGLRAGWERCVEEARRGQPEALAWVGMLGGEEEMGLLLEAVQRPETRHAALCALGCSGRRAAAEECLKWLGDEDERTAKLAAEAFGMVTGVDAYADGFGAEELEDEELPRLEEDLAEELAGAAGDALPRPAVEAFVRWWAEQGAAFKGDHRYLHGATRSAARLESSVDVVPMRQVWPLRGELAVRSNRSVSGLFTGAPRGLWSRSRGGDPGSYPDVQRRPKWS
jgi:uncharacterized protein (TIGR02270 family)